MKFSVVSCAAAAMTPAHLAACQALWNRQWPSRPGCPVDPHAHAAPVGYAMLLAPDGRLGGACHWIERIIFIAGQPHPIAGLACVLVEPSLRGQGQGTRLVLTATDWARVRGYHWAVLFCATGARGFYERLGWRQLEGDIFVTRFGERGPLEPGAIIMALPLNEAAALQLPQWLTATVEAGAGQW